jgi:malate synthase
VPSPTGATLHALHYHQVNVAKLQKQMEKADAKSNAKVDYNATLNTLLTIPRCLTNQLEPRRKTAGAGQQRPRHFGLRRALD